MKYIVELINRCNFACTYCYLAEAGRLNQNPLEQKMSTATGTQTIVYLANLAEETGQMIYVDFLNGEPLLNVDVLKHMVETGRKLEKRSGRPLFAFRFTTNGSLLTESIIEFTLSHNVYFNVSVDGIQKCHDTHRVYPSGFGTSGDVHSKLSWLAGINGVGVVSTYTNWTWPYLSENVAFFMEQDIRNIEISFYQSHTQYPRTDHEGLIHEFSKALDLFLDRYRRHDFRFSFVELDRQIIRSFSRTTSPPACDYPYRITFNGEIEYCDRVPFEHNQRIGSVYSDSPHSDEHYCKSCVVKRCDVCVYRSSCVPCAIYLYPLQDKKDAQALPLYCSIMRTLIETARTFAAETRQDPVMAERFDQSKFFTDGLKYAKVVNTVQSGPTAS